MSARICLNMIVRNEAHVIDRCLDRVRHLIDTWVIVDTGSNDGTQARIRSLLDGVPGQLIERPWRDFGYNRTEAARLARGTADFLLFLDADDVLDISPDFQWPALDLDAYDLAIVHAGLVYRRIALVRASLNWRFTGVLHEYPECDSPHLRHGSLEGLRLKYGGDGARSQAGQAAKFAADAAVLEAGLRAEPGNARYAFYLAQSYRDAGQPEAALAAYDRRVAMPGFDQETYCARLEGARLARKLGRASAEIMERFLLAHQERPARAEPLGELAVWCREAGPRWPLAFLFASRAIELPQPPDILFVETSWYQWRAMDEYSIAAYWTGQFARSIQACDALLQGMTLPAEQRLRVERNRQHALARLAPDTV